MAAPELAEGSRPDSREGCDLPAGQSITTRAGPDRHRAVLDIRLAGRRLPRASASARATRPCDAIRASTTQNASNIDSANEAPSTTSEFQLHNNACPRKLGNSTTDTTSFCRAVLC